MESQIFISPNPMFCPPHTPRETPNTHDDCTGWVVPTLQGKAVHGALPLLPKSSSRPLALQGACLAYRTTQAHGIYAEQLRHPPPRSPSHSTQQATPRPISYRCEQRDPAEKLNQKSSRCRDAKMGSGAGLKTGVTKNLPPFSHQHPECLTSPAQKS